MSEPGKLGKDSIFGDIYWPIICANLQPILDNPDIEINQNRTLGWALNACTDYHYEKQMHDSLRVLINNDCLGSLQYLNLFKNVNILSPSREEMYQFLQKLGKISYLMIVTNNKLWPYGTEDRYRKIFAETVIEPILDKLLIAIDNSLRRPFNAPLTLLGSIWTLLNEFNEAYTEKGKETLRQYSLQNQAKVNMMQAVYNHHGYKIPILRNNDKR